MACTDLCLYYETYKNFAPNRTYETHKQCTRCDHVVPKKDFPDTHCYCCNAKYRDKFPKSMKTRKIARIRKRYRQEKEILLITK